MSSQSEFKQTLRMLWGEVKHQKAVKKTESAEEPSAEEVSEEPVEETRVEEKTTKSLRQKVTAGAKSLLRRKSATEPNLQSKLEAFFE